MQLYQKFKFTCSDFLKEFGLSMIEKKWNYNSSEIIRINTLDSRLDILKKELIEKKFPGINSMSIFCRAPNSRQEIHIDTLGDGSTVSKGNFYIPLLPNGGKILWFNKDKGFTVNTGSKILWVNKDKDIPTMKRTPDYINSNNIPTVVETYLKAIVGEYAKDDPVIINTSIPHCGVSFGNPRSVLIFRLNGNPDLFDLVSGK